MRNPIIDYDCDGWIFPQAFSVRQSQKIFGLSQFVVKTIPVFVNFLGDTVTEMARSWIIYIFKLKFITQFSKEILEVSE